MKNTHRLSLFTGLILLLGACGNAVAEHWQPTLNPDTEVQPPKWDWQLQVPVLIHDDPTIEIYDIDMFENEYSGMVQQLKTLGKKVICYVNVGAWEDYRDDETNFPSSILGNVYDRFPNEKWLDIRDVNPAKSTTGMALRSILEARFDRAQQMGCDAVEPDNMDGFDESSHNPSGFPLTYEDQIYFNLWLAQEVHERGMAVGFKNNTNQALDARMVDAFDFVVTESCVYFNECLYFDGFLAANKPVFLTEYLIEPEEFCGAAKERRISGIKKRFALDSYRLDCDNNYDNGQEPQPPATNLLVNGGFESDLNGWQYCGNSSGVTTSTLVSQGSKALQTQGSAGCLYQEVPIEVGTEYTLSCDANRAGNAWSILQFSMLDAGYNIIDSEFLQIESGGEYANYAMTLTAMQDSRYALALIYSEDEMLVDNCSLTTVIEPELEPELPPITNLLINGGFEFDLLSWQSCGNPNALSLSVDTSEGDKALAIVGGAGCLYQEVPATIGKSYSLSCDAKRQGTAWSILQLSYLGVLYDNLNTEFTQIGAGGDFAAHTISGGVVPASAAHVVALIYSEDQTAVDNCVLSME